MKDIETGHDENSSSLELLWSRFEKKLLASPEKDIDTFVKTLEIASREEMAIRQTRELTSSPNTHSTVPVHQLKSGRVSGRTHSHHTTTSTSKPERNSTQSGRKRNCYRCGSDGHLADKCYYKATECKFCHKKGHLERVCMAKSRRGRIPVNNVIADGSDQELEEQDESFPCVPLFTIVEMSSKGVPPYAVQVHMNDMPIHVRMEIDTGSGISILNRRDYEKLGGSTSTLSTPTVRLMGFSGSAIKCLGETVMDVCVNGVTLPALLRIVDNNGPSLLGRDMLTKFRLPWEDIFAVKTEIDKALETANDREEIITQFPTLFDTTTVGRLNTTKMTLRVNDERPVFMRARKVPFAISEKCETTFISNELQSFIGSANYSRKFIPRFAAIMIPLYALLRKNAIWKWDAAETNAFNEIKSALCSAEVLAYYSNDKRLKLQTDASGSGLGAVLLQEESTGTFRPISYASRVLAKAELNYSNIERKSLALVFGVTTFRQYLLGRQFMLETDHQPLVKLFGCTEGVPILVSSRLKKWKMTLAAYDYVITYIPGRQNFIADFMSRKPVPGVPSPTELADEQVLFVETEVINASSVSAETQRDPVLKKALQYTLNGWPESTTDQELLPYFTKRWELSVADNILLWNERVVVPESLRELLLNDLHYEHSGAVRMKRLARRYVWWPRIDKEIEETATQCQDCQEQARMPAKEYASWSWPTGPWQRIHIDFAGPFMGKMFLVIVDAYSRFLEIVPMDRATSTGTIAAMQRVLGIFGLPSHVVSDNGAQFTSEEFKRFLKANGILHTCTAPGHPATNGLAERYVGYFKSKLRAMGSQGNLQTTLYRFLFSHRTTPLANGKTPAELLLNRQPRTRFDLLKHDNKSTVDAFERNLGRTPEFRPGDAVFTLNFGVHGAKWVPGHIVTARSALSYEVQVQDAIWKRHRNQLRPRSVPLSDFTREDVLPEPLNSHEPIVSHSEPQPQRFTNVQPHSKPTVPSAATENQATPTDSSIASTTTKTTSGEMSSAMVKETVTPRTSSRTV